MSSRNVVILGGGLAGLSAAWALQKQGFSVTILEKESYAGGLAITRQDNDGYRWDLGPHNIHTVHKHILLFLKKNFTALYEHSVSSFVYKRGRFLLYPLKGIKILVTLPFFTLLRAAFSFLVARLFMFLFDARNDRNFAEWIRNRFGKVLFEEYFLEYPRKVWCLEPENIDKIVAEKRIPIMSLTDLIRTVFLGKKVAIDHPEWTDANFYLPGGIGALPEFFRANFEKLGGRILYRAEIQKICTEAGRVTAVEYRSSQGGPVAQHHCDFMLTTIPIPDVVSYFDVCPETVRAAAPEIRYLCSVLVFLKMNSPDLLVGQLLYFPEQEIKFSRVSDVASFSRQMVPAGKNLVCLEFPCMKNDATWKESQDVLIAHAVEHLTKRGVIKREQVEGGFVEHVENSYPQFRNGFTEHLERCKSFIHSFPNALTFGRQGGFMYVNTDAVMNLGFKAAQAVSVGDALGYKVSEWFEVK